MASSKIRSIGFFWLFFFACLCSPWGKKTFSQEQPSEQDQVRAVVEGFFRSVEKKDIDGLMALWSESSPQLPASRERFVEAFGRIGSVELKSLAFKKLELSRDKATVRATVEMNASDVKTGKTADGFGKLNRTLRLAREGGAWKVYEYEPSEKELALAIVAAKTSADRRT